MNASERAWSLLKVEVVELVEYDFPGWIRVRLVDADGVPWIFEDKIPIFFYEDEPTPATTLPAPAHIRCEVLRAELDDDGREVLIVSTAGRPTEIEKDLDEFRVRREQLEEPNESIR
ncbi:hypothetical protein [Catellatospora sp. NPDC049609]|uniref:hypothetical protein n=1 Tax=Catellatospora sp. NPDC049609 TaxID=3155505 RepID=UPI0034369B81